MVTQRDGTSLKQATWHSVLSETTCLGGMWERSGGRSGMLGQGERVREKVRVKGASGWKKKEEKGVNIL